MVKIDSTVEETVALQLLALSNKLMHLGILQNFECFRGVNDKASVDKCVVVLIVGEISTISASR